MKPRNPFDVLYMTEHIDPDNFVDVFSPFLVHDTSSLYRQGNIVLMGTQGSGKSMLLTLLKPETRIAYAQANRPFPLDKSAPPFIGAGINLGRSGATDFGQRPLPDGRADEPGAVAAYFADFLNYWIVRDLLESVELLASFNDGSGKLAISTQPLDEFSRVFARHHCWAGGLEGVTTYQMLTESLERRIHSYRNFFNFNVDDFDARHKQSKTSPGLPISVAAESLKSSGVIGEETEVFIRIDQYETLRMYERWRQGKGESPEFDGVIHKMLGMRDANVSYRIGTRSNSWPSRPRILGTSETLEELRNFKIVDLDELLTSTEHKRPFGRFAEDVFRRRIQWAGYTAPSKANCVRSVFRASLKPEEEAMRYVKYGKFNPLEGIGNDDDRRILRTLSEKRALDAKFAEAYILQKGPGSIAPDQDGKYPWEGRKWWTKERNGQALLQIAARQKQKLLWYGADDIVALSGSNILAFVTLSQMIWDAWLRQGDRDVETAALPEITSIYDQDEGIQQASHHWFRKIRSDQDGDARQRFVRLVGEKFREWLRADDAMSYPGHNGFSIDVEELHNDPEVSDFLHEAASFGVLVQRIHTTRAKSGRKRIKWYLAPIFSPYFQITHSHVKEPRYVRVSEVREWLVEAGILAPSDQAEPISLAKTVANQPSLFSADDG